MYLSHNECESVKKTKKSKTFRADITPGLSKDIDSLQESLGTKTNTDLLRFTVRLWQRYEKFFYEKAEEIEEYGIEFDRHVFNKTKGSTTEATLNRKIFGLMLFFSEMLDKQIKAYMDALEKDGLTAKEFIEMLTAMEEKK